MVTVSKADRALVAIYRSDYGFQRRHAPLLSPPDANQKLEKNELPTYSLSLAHARTGVRPDGSRAGMPNLCPFSTPECRAHCVADSGKGGIASVKRARSWKTALFADHPVVFRRIVEVELRRAVAKHGAIGFRPNAFSDVEWELVAPSWFEIPGVTAYDYTKRPIGSRSLPSNYHLTYSVTERWSDQDVADATQRGVNVAVVLDVKRGDALPKRFRGAQVVDGDASDFRPADPRVGDGTARRRGAVVGLRAKGTLRSVESGFKRLTSV